MATRSVSGTEPGRGGSLNSEEASYAGWVIQFSRSCISSMSMNAEIPLSWELYTCVQTWGSALRRCKDD